MSRVNALKLTALILALLCVTADAALLIIRADVIGDLYDKDAATAWSPGGGYAQVSCFLPEERGLTPEAIESVRYGIDSILIEDSYEDPTQSHRIWTDCAVLQTEVYAGEIGNTLAVRAYGTLGDCFAFHPLDMSDGWYYADDDPQYDAVIINEQLAWEIYGGTKLAGMPIEICGTECIIAGVARGALGRAEDSALGDEPAIWMPYRLLQRLGMGGTFTSYEVILPDPITDYAENTLKSVLGEDIGTYIAQSGRFGIINSLDTLRKLDTMIQRTDKIPLPYFENAARTVLCRSALLSGLCAVLALYPAVVLLILAVKLILFLRKEKPLSRCVKRLFKRKSA